MYHNLVPAVMIYMLLLLSLFNHPLFSSRFSNVQTFYFLSIQQIQTLKKRKPGEIFLPAEVCGNSLLLPRTLSPYIYLILSLGWHWREGDIADCCRYTLSALAERVMDTADFRTPDGLYRGCEEL